MIISGRRLPMTEFFRSGERLLLAAFCLCLPRNHEAPRVLAVPRAFTIQAPVYEPDPSGQRQTAMGTGAFVVQFLHRQCVQMHVQRVAHARQIPARGITFCGLFVARHPDVARG
jgi:hypothetical protein